MSLDIFLEVKSGEPETFLINKNRLYQQRPSLDQKNPAFSNKSQRNPQTSSSSDLSVSS